jgi:hypothetical protein
MVGVGRQAALVHQCTHSSHLLSFEWGAHGYLRSTKPSLHNAQLHTYRTLEMASQSTASYSAKLCNSYPALLSPLLLFYAHRATVVRKSESVVSCRLQYATSGNTEILYSTSGQSPRRSFSLIMAACAHDYPRQLAPTWSLS